MNKLCLAVPQLFHHRVASLQQAADNVNNLAAAGGAPHQAAANTLAARQREYTSRVESYLRRRARQLQDPHARTAESLERMERVMAAMLDIMRFRANLPPLPPAEEDDDGDDDNGDDGAAQGGNAGGNGAGASG